MVLTVLSENTTASKELDCEHGLCLHIETGSRKILFDTGASGLFAENAKKLGIDITQVDTAVISHGHYDHGGGLETFLRVNGKAAVYLHRKAFEKHYSARTGGVAAYIGLNESLQNNERFIFCGDRFTIDEGIELFSDVYGERLVPSGNAGLLTKKDDVYIPDDFSHEQNLIITEGHKSLLLAGCAHKGIVNIIDRFTDEKKRPPDYVVGGFHLKAHSAQKNETPHVIDSIAGILSENNTLYYTCHCTGLEAYNRMKTVMGEKLGYLSAGDKLTVTL
ncbi:MAG: MBL fold metallo-hydrolase [Eubacteriales bacterium]|nr:MBL fold metallo-hydrolase [Eubacteriales bacterium]